MADLSNKLFRRTKAGDPVNKVLDTGNLNFVYSVLEDIQGVYCRIEKPTDAGGRGWRIVFDPNMPDEAPPDGEFFFTFRVGDADAYEFVTEAGECASWSITKGDNEYDYHPEVVHDESGSAGKICASAVFRLYGFRMSADSAEVCGYHWGDGSGKTSATCITRDNTVGLPWIEYTELADALWREWRVDTEIGSQRTIERTCEGTCGPMPYTLQLCGFSAASASTFIQPGFLFLARRKDRTSGTHSGDNRQYLMGLSTSSIVDYFDDDIEDEIDEELTSSSLSAWLSSRCENLFEFMRIFDERLYGAGHLPQGGNVLLWDWIPLTCGDYSGNAREELSALNSNLSALRSGLTSASGALSGALSGLTASGIEDEMESASSALESASAAAEEVTSAMQDLMSGISDVYSGLAVVDGMMAGFETRLSALEGA